MKARTFIGGATLVLIVGAILGYSATVPEGCADRAAVANSDFDPFKLSQSDKVQEPWLDPFVFFSDKAYVVFADTATAIPEVAAAFAGGNDKMVGHLKEHIIPHVAKGTGWLKPPVISFTVNAQGGTEDVVLVESCGNALLDAWLVGSIRNMPVWKPARDADGEATAQSFVFRVVQAACDQQPPTVPIRSVSMYDIPLSDRTAALEHPYDLEFRLEKGEGNTYTLITTMDLHGGSFYISPNAKRDFKGKFRVEIADQDHVVLGERIKEIPRSVEVIDLHPFVDGTVEWVNEDTRYEHTFTLMTKEDLDVGGKYSFTIEPKCTLEEVPFMIKQRSGVLTIEKWKC